MSQERLKVLEMLEAGKISAEDAVKLLEALAEETTEEHKHEETTEEHDTEEPTRWRRQRRRQHRSHLSDEEEHDPEQAPRRGRRRRRQRNQDPFPNDWQHLAEEMENIQAEIHTRVEQARETLRASMPRVKQAVQDAIPEVDRIIKESFSTMPNIGKLVKESLGTMPDIGELVRDAMNTASATFSEWAESTGERHSEKAERDRTETHAVQPGSRVALRTPRGYIRVETWDKDEIQIDSHILIRATDQAAAQIFAEAIEIEVTPEPGVIHIQPNIPKRDEHQEKTIGSCQVDFLLHIPQKMDLDLSTTHGNIELPDIEGTVVMKNHHGNMNLSGATRSVVAHQHHGNVEIGPIGGDFTLNSHHGHAKLGEVAGTATVQIRHGNLSTESVGQNADISIRHGKLDLGRVGGNAAVEVNHGPVTLEAVDGDLDISVNQGSITVRETGGNIQAVNNHGPMRFSNVAGNIIAQNNHGSIQADQVGGQVVAKTNKGDIRLNDISGAVTAENKDGPIRIDRPGSGVMVQNQNGDIRIHSRTGIGGDYVLQSKGGNISVDIPENAAIDVQACVTRGQIHTDLPLEISGDKKTGQSVTGQINGGGAKLTVELQRGDLSLQTCSGEPAEPVEPKEMN